MSTYNIFFICFVISVSMLILTNPKICLLAAVASTPFNEIFFLDIGVKIRLYQIFVLLMLISWTTKLMSNKEKKSHLDRNPLTLILIVIIITNMLSLINTISFWDSIIIFGINVFLVLLYFLVYYHLFSVKMYQQVILVLVTVSNLVAMYGIYQSMAYFVGIKFGLGPAEKIARWTPNLWGVGRAFSTFVEPVEFGAYTMLIILFLIPLFNSNYFRRWKLFIGISLVIQIAGNLMAMSRASWIGLIAGVLVYQVLLFVSKEKGRMLKSIKISILMTYMIFILLTFLAIFPIGIYDNLINRILDRDSYSTLIGRTIQVQSYLTRIQEHPIIGHGVGMGPHIGLEAIGLETAVSRGGSGPNIFISTLFQTGILGLIALVWMYITFVRKILLALSRTDSNFFRPLLMSMLIGIVGLLLTYQVNYFFIQPFLWVYFAIGMATVRFSELRK